MKKNVMRFTAGLLICCLLAGTSAYAQEPSMETDAEEEEETIQEAEQVSGGNNVGDVGKEEPGDGAKDSTPEEAGKDSGTGETQEPEKSEEPETPGAEETSGAENEGDTESGTDAPADSKPTEEETKQPSSEADTQTTQTTQTVKTAQTAKTTQTPKTQKIKPVPKSKTIRVLLVGNSLTYRRNNTTITNLKKLAKKSGRKLVLKRLTYNNEKMVHWANPKHKNGKRLYREIRTKRWDYIVFQEQTDASVKNSFVSASKKVSKYIHGKSPKTQIMYNCTWAYKKGKKVSGKYYSFSKMQQTMNRNYQLAASQTGGRVCWSGKAFLTYRKRKGKKKNLYLKDNNHGSKYGWYLNACCLYASIFGHSPTESKYYAGLSKKEAKILQKIAAMEHF